MVVKPFAPYPLDRGTNILTFNLLRELRKEFAVTLLARRPEDERDARAALAAVCDRLMFCDPPNLRSMVARLSHGINLRLRALMNSKPLTAGYAELAFSAPLRELLTQNEFTLVQIEYWNLAELGSLCPPKVPRCLFMHDVQPRLLKREAAFAQSRVASWRLRRASRKASAFERIALRHFSHILTVTENDARVYRDIAGPASEVHCVPTLFDVSGIQPVSDPGGHELVFVGAMGHRPNRDAVLYFAREVLPIIRAEAPQAKLVIVGRDAPDCVRALHGPGVAVVGAVDSVRPYLESAAVYVAPLRFGSGIKIKILEALAHGKALVTTTVGAEGIEIEHGRHCLIADSAPDFAKSVVALLRDRSLRDGMGKAGRKIVEEKHSPESAGPRVRGVYRRIIQEFGRNA